MEFTRLVSEGSLRSRSFSRKFLHWVSLNGRSFVRSSNPWHPIVRPRKPLVAFFDLLSAPGSLVIAKSVWFDKGARASKLRISGVCRTGKEHGFDEALGNQVEVTWLSFPDHTIDWSENYPKFNATLSSVQLGEALDIAGLDSIEETPKEPGRQPSYTIQDFVMESGFPP